MQMNTIQQSFMKDIMIQKISLVTRVDLPSLDFLDFAKHKWTKRQQTIMMKEKT